MYIKYNTLKKIIKEAIYTTLLENKQNELLAYHGTLKDFNNFDLKFIGQGEGSQVYGHGVYVTGVEDTGKWYGVTIAMNKAKEFGQEKNKTRSILLKITRALPPGIKQKKEFSAFKNLILNTLEKNKEKYKGLDKKEEFDIAKEKVNACNSFEEYDNMIKDLSYLAVDQIKKYLYVLEIPEEGYIDWDNNNPQFINGIFNEIKNHFANYDLSKFNCDDFVIFGDMFEALRGWRNQSDLKKYGEFIPQKDLSLFLSKKYNGIRVPTGFKSGGDNRGDNYVIFNPKNIKILEKRPWKTIKDFEVK